MVHIAKRTDGLFTTAILHSKNHEFLAGAPQQGFASKQKAFQNVVAVMEETGSKKCYVQDDTLKSPIVFRLSLHINPSNGKRFVQRKTSRNKIEKKYE